MPVTQRQASQQQPAVFAFAALPPELQAAVFVQLLHSCPPGEEWDPWAARQVCRAWRAKFDAVAAQAEVPARLQGSFWLPAGAQTQHAWLQRFAASRRVAALAGAHSLQLKLEAWVDLEDSQLGAGDNPFEQAEQAALHMNAAALRAAPRLRSLALALPNPLADQLDIVLGAAATSLRSLGLVFVCSDAELDEEELQGPLAIHTASPPALERALRRLTALEVHAGGGLPTAIRLGGGPCACMPWTLALRIEGPPPPLVPRQELSVSPLPAVSFQLGPIAAALPQTLTRLALDVSVPFRAHEWGVDPGSGYVQQLSHLTRLQDLSLRGGALDGGAQPNTVPRCLSALTRLVVECDSPLLRFEGSVSALPLRRLALTQHNGDGWVPSITGCTGLTLLDWGSYNHEQRPPPDLSALSLLEHLRLASHAHPPPLALPDLAPLACSLRSLSCDNCTTDERFLAALPQLQLLTALELACYEELAPGSLDSVSRLTALQHLHLDSGIYTVLPLPSSLAPLASSLRCLKLHQCDTDAAFVAALPRLIRLTRLKLISCDLSAAAPCLDLRALTALRLYAANSCKLPAEVRLPPSITDPGSRRAFPASCFEAAAPWYGSE